MRYLTIALTGLALSITTACSSSKPTVTVTNTHQSQYAQSHYVFTPTAATAARKTQTSRSAYGAWSRRQVHGERQVQELKSQQQQRAQFRPTIQREWNPAFATQQQAQRPIKTVYYGQSHFARTRMAYNAQSQGAQQLYQLFRGKLSDDQLVLLVQPLTYREDLPKVIRDAAYATMIDYYQRTDQPWKAMQIGEQMMQAYVNE
jgi:hypothetical protein